MGVPVIATNLRGIREIVSENSGVLVEAQSVDQLLDAVKKIDEYGYHELCQGARKKFSEFETINRTKFFLKKIRV